LEVDGLGGFASGAIDGVRRRRYHALLQVADREFTARLVLVNGLDVHLVTPTGRYPLSSQAYSPGVISPDTRGNVVAFDSHPWPTWRLRAPDGTEIIHEIMIHRGSAATVARWRIGSGSHVAYLSARPLISGRDAHALHRENRSFEFEPDIESDWLVWPLYPGVPGLALGTNASYTHDPKWYRNFRYEHDLARGYDYEEDLAAPGILTWDLSKDDAVMVMAGVGPGFESIDRITMEDPVRLAGNWRETEQERRSKLSPDRVRLDDYLVERDSQVLVTGGFPWFQEDPRAAGFLARALVRKRDGLSVAGTVIRHCLSLKPDDCPVDACLWWIVAIHELLEMSEQEGYSLPIGDPRRFRSFIQSLLDYIIAANIEENNFALDDDDLLRIGPGGTWMDGRVGERLATPRAGKPVEIQALWLNALRIGSLIDSRWESHFENGLKTFRSRFWNSEQGCLFDVVDGDAGLDGTVRPNQVLAVGGLPFPLLKRPRSAKVLAVVEQVLLTPAGLRSLDPQSIEYRGHCRGGEWERTAAMHQGSVWFWCLGPFVEGWLRIHGPNDQNLELARRRFLEPVENYLGMAMPGHYAELTDGNPPHQWRGCPAYAISDAVLDRLRDCLKSDV
jgi:glycogen debranching enzyme